MELLVDILRNLDGACSRRVVLIGRPHHMCSHDLPFSTGAQSHLAGYCSCLQGKGSTSWYNDGAMDQGQTHGTCSMKSIICSDHQDQYLWQYYYSKTEKTYLQRSLHLICADLLVCMSHDMATIAVSCMPEDAPQNVDNLTTVHRRTCASKKGYSVLTGL